MPLRSERELGGPRLRPVFRTYGVLLFAAVVGLWGSACGRPGSEAEGLLRYVPASAAVVATLEWPVIVGDSALQGLVRGGNLAAELARLGMPEEDLRQVVIFTDLRSTRDGGTGMVLVTLTRERRILDHLRESGWRVERVAGLESWQKDGEDASVARLSKTAWFVGTNSAVTMVAEAKRDPERSIVSNPLFKEIARAGLHSRTPVRMQVLLPRALGDVGFVLDGAADVLTGLVTIGPIGELLGKIGLAQAVSLGVRREGDRFPLEVVAIMKDEGAARLVSGGLGLLKGVSSLIPNGSPSDQQAQEMLNSLDATREGNRVRLVLSVPEEELRR